MIITPTKTARALFFLLALALLGLGAWTTTARFLLLPGDGVRAALLDHREVSPDAQERFDASRRAVLGFFATGAVLDDLAFSTTLRADKLDPASPTSRVLRAAALSWQRRSLALAPANTYGMARLTDLLLHQEGPTPRAARALALTGETGFFEPPLLRFRVQAAAALDAVLEPETRAALPFLVRTVFEESPDTFVKDAQKHAFVPFAARALADDPAALASFKALLAE